MADTNMTKQSNPKDAMASTRLDMTLFPDTAVAYGALAFTEGARKYGASNWRKVGVSASVYLAACKRHLAKYYNGEEADAKTGVPHLASALACIAVIIDATVVNKLVDDRPPVSGFEGSAFFDQMEEHVKQLQGLFPNPVPRYTEK
jgi:hypothetical protein